MCIIQAQITIAFTYLLFHYYTFFYTLYRTIIYNIHLNLNKKYDDVEGSIKFTNVLILIGSKI